MRFKLPFQRKEKIITAEGAISPVVTRDIVEEIAAPFKYVRTYTCSCGNNMRIRARDHRDDGPSNFKLRSNGTSILEAGELNWNGLAEERGWKVSPVQCPACIAGLSTLDYKITKRAEAAGLSVKDYKEREGIA